MSLVAAAVCPHPPLLVPELAAGAAAELDELRSACDAAVRRLVEVAPDRLVTIGMGRWTRVWAATQQGSFARYGVRLPAVGFGPRRPGDAARPAGSGGCAPAVPDVRPAPRSRCADAGPAADLPLSLTIGAWLLSRASVGDLTLAGQSVAGTLPAAQCAALGAAVAGSGDRVALLVMGDGSACRGVRAPGYHDPRAEPYDQVVAAALAAANPAALLSLDAELSAQLRVAGRAPWQVLAGAAAASGRRWHGQLRYARAPYGVAYFVALWEPA